MKTYNRIVRAAYSTAWAIQPEKLEALLAFLAWKAVGKGPSTEVLQEIQLQSLEAAVRAESLSNTPGSVALLPLFGLISHRANMMGDISGPRGTSVDQFTQRFRQAVSDPSCKAIVIDVDSPGGTVDGVPELAEEIYKARGKKPITAVADCLMASAAYWIGCAASELVCSPSAAIGSIGVYCAHEDDSQLLESEGIKITLIAAGKYKTEGNPFEPLGDEAKAAMQSMVDDYYSMFLKTVAKGRGVKAEDVQSGFGQGRVVTAQQAVKLGMADRIGTLDSVLAKYGVSRGNAAAVSTNVHPRSSGGSLPEGMQWSEPDETETLVSNVHAVFSVPPEQIGGPLESKSYAVAKPAKADDSCTCPCDPCGSGDCESCDHEACDCAGCTCPDAMEQAKASALENAVIHGRMRDRIELASL